MDALLLVERGGDSVAVLTSFDFVVHNAPQANEHHIIDKNTDLVKYSLVFLPYLG